MSYQAYQNIQQRSETPRATEYRLFVEVTRALLDVKELPIHDPKVIKALDWNRRMWSTFSIDCGSEGNQLPEQLRASIISLSIWVSKHTSLVMKKQETMDALIDINKTIMEGLAPQQQQAAAPQSPAPARPASNFTGGFSI